MLQSMREGAKSPIMKAFLLFLAAGFALWGIGDISSGLFSDGNKAIKAGDKSATAVEVATEFERIRRTAGGGISTGDAVQFGLLDEVVGTTARQILFEAEADRLGLTSTKAMQTDAIRQEPTFADALGEFSSSAFRSSLAQSGFTEPAYLARLDSVLLQEQLLQAVSLGGQFPDVLLDRIARYQLEKRTASWLVFSAETQNIAPPTDTELDTFYSEQKSSYDAPQMRSAEVILLSPAMIAPNLVIEETELRDAFEARQDEFIRPESRTIRQMVFSTEELAQAALEKLNAGDSFADVANAALGWSAEDTELGTVERSELATELAAPLFEAALNQVAGPVQSAFGWHLAIIDVINPAESSAYEDVKAAISSRLAEEQALDRIYDFVAQLEDALGSGATMQEAASLVDSQLVSIDGIDVNGRDIDGNEIADTDSTIANLAGDSLFITELFATDIQTISPVIETGADTFFVVKPVSETESRERALAEVKDRVIDDWRAEQAIAQARADAQQAQAGNLAQTGALSVSTGFSRLGTGIDSDFARLIANTSFETDMGQIALADTGEGTILVRTDGIIAASDDEVNEQIDQLRGDFDSLIHNDINSAIGIRLADIHSLDVNPDMVRQLLLGQTGQ